MSTALLVLLVAVLVAVLVAIFLFGVLAGKISTLIDTSLERNNLLIRSFGGTPEWKKELAASEKRSFDMIVKLFKFKQDSGVWLAVDDTAKEAKVSRPSEDASIAGETNYKPGGDAPYVSKNGLEISSSGSKGSVREV